MIRSLRLSIALTAIALLLSGCASKIEERKFYDHKRTTTILRSHLENGKPIDRSFQHPVEITEERLRRMLATLQVQVAALWGDDETKPAIHPAILRGVVRALSESLAEANSSEEVALSAIRKSRSLGLFSEEFLTTFVAYVKDDVLTVSFSRVDWNLRNMRQSASNQRKLPLPRLGEKQMDFRIVQSPDYEAAGQQAVGIRYADAKWGGVESAVVEVDGEPVAAEPEASTPETTAPTAPATATPSP